MVCYTDSLAVKGRKTIFSKTSVEMWKIVTIMSCGNVAENFIPPLATFVRGKIVAQNMQTGFRFVR